MLFANLMFGNVGLDPDCSLRVSGSENSNGPA